MFMYHAYQLLNTKRFMILDGVLSDLKFLPMVVRGVCAFQMKPYSYLSASIGLMRAARLAG